MSTTVRRTPFLRKNPSIFSEDGFARVHESGLRPASFLLFLNRMASSSTGVADRFLIHKDRARFPLPASAGHGEDPPLQCQPRRTSCATPDSTLTNMLRPARTSAAAASRTKPHG